MSLAKKIESRPLPPALQAECLLSTQEAAKFCGVSPAFFIQARIKGIDTPKYLKIGRRVLYRPGDLRDWLAKHERSSTSQQ